VLKIERTDLRDGALWIYEDRFMKSSS